MKKKVVLVLPNFRWRESVEHILWDYVPYGLCMLAAVLENKYDVAIIDAYKKNLTEDEFVSQIKNENPDVVGVTALMDYFGPTLHKAAALVKMLYPEIPVVAGGVYPTTNMDKVLEDTNIDFLIAGEGEYALLSLLDYIFTNKGESEDWHEDGVYYLECGNIVGSGRGKISDLDMLPLPAYHLLDFEDYIRSDEQNRVNLPSKMPYASIYTSRGCPYNCSFCQIEYILGRGFRKRSVENVFEEVDWLIAKYNIRSLVIIDDNFLIDRNRAITLIKGFAERDLEWMIMDAAVYLLDDELLEIMAECGCRNLCYCIETGNMRVMRDVIHKPIKSLEYVVHLVRKAQSVGIYVEANFIIGFPDETWNEIRETIHFAETLEADYVRFFVAYPLPHTELYKKCTDKKCFIKGFNAGDIDWKTGCIETEEFTREDLLILRTYEWDRINFMTQKKRERTMWAMGLDEKGLEDLRRRTFRETKKLLSHMMVSDNIKRGTY